MAALSADLNVSSVGPVIELPFSANAADTFYQGAVVWGDAAGGAQATAAAGDRVLGISTSNQVIAASGDEVRVAVWGHFWFPSISGIAAGDEGNLLLFDADGTLSDNIDDCDSTEAITEAANDAVVGRILRVKSDKVCISIGHAGMTGALFVATANYFS